MKSGYGSLSAPSSVGASLAGMSRRVLVVILAIVLGAASSSEAANRYVRAGAAGNGSGSDWTNAYTALPAVLTRGDTYYVAAGTYAAYRFDDPLSGSLQITIKKATEADHGTATGWQASYGTGQAVFSSSLRFDRGNYVFDGQTRDENDWFNGAAYGFRIAHNNQDQNIVINGNSHNITIRYTFIDAIIGSLPGNTVRRYAIDTDPFDSNIFTTGLVFSRMFINGSNNQWFIRGTEGAIIEYSASDCTSGNDANHGENVNLYFTTENTIIRFNIFRRSFDNGCGQGDGGGTAVIASQDTNGHQIYGNVFDRFQVGDAAIGFYGGNSSNMQIYNNTFVKAPSGSGGIQAGVGSGNVIRNNLWVGVASPGITVGNGAVVTHNAFSGASSAGTSAQTNVAVSVFMNYTQNDYRLAVPTNAGFVLSAPFDTDLRGVKRPADGIFDRGAYEYPSVSQAVPSAPSNLRIVP